MFTRYVLNSAASWPEPAAILLSIVLTFFGAAACYRRLHMRVSFFDHLPPLLRRLTELLAELLMAAMALFMTVWGGSSRPPGTTPSPISRPCRSA